MRILRVAALLCGVLAVLISLFGPSTVAESAGPPRAILASGATVIAAAAPDDDDDGWTSQDTVLTAGFAALALIGAGAVTQRNRERKRDGDGQQRDLAEQERENIAAAAADVATALQVCLLSIQTRHGAKAEPRQLNFNETTVREVIGSINRLDMKAGTLPGARDLRSLGFAILTGDAFRDQSVPELRYRVDLLLERIRMSTRPAG